MTERTEAILDALDEWSDARDELAQARAYFERHRDRSERDDGDGYMVAFGVTDSEDDNYNVSQAKVRVGIAREALGTALEGLVT